jgi:hypothetical protein
MSNIFSKLGLQAFRAGITPRTEESREWFRKKAKNLRSINRRALMKEEPIRQHSTKNARALIGSMQMFMYDPKTKDKLPYYDTFPLVVVVGPAPGGFYGLNLHYLPPILRAKMLDALMDIQSSPKSGDAKFNLRYKTLKASSKLKWYKPCFKHYLNTQVESRFAEVSAPEWEIATFLPTASWRKSNSQKVFADSRKQIGK